ncbi:MAG: hypothetical protein CXT67_09945 [Methanobacteriota archaeon]|nr:MAG: hypothetical protein CXT67_09945 [Euryarchaeota archaeon]
MGTVLTNPFELNFGGLAARNAENIKEAETTSGLLSSETRTTSCNSIYPNLQVEIYEQTRVHPNPYNNPNLAVTCEGYYYPDNPGNGDRNCGTQVGRFTFLQAIFKEIYLLKVLNNTIHP